MPKITKRSAKQKTMTNRKKNNQKFKLISFRNPIFLFILFLIITLSIVVYNSGILSINSLLQASISQSTYFVSLTGNDSNTGSETQPFRTVAKALIVAVPGDTIFIRGGTYNEKINVSKSGTADKPITIAAAPGEKPVFDLNMQSNPNVSVTGSYVIVDGLELKNSNGQCATIKGTYNIFRNSIVHNCMDHAVYTDTSNITIEHNIVYLGSMRYQNTTASSGWGSGIKVRVGGSNITIRNNNVFNIWGEGIAVTRGSNVNVERNTVYDNFAANIYIDNSYDVVVDSNFSYCTRTSGFEKNGIPVPGIALGEEYYDGWGNQLARVRISNNIVHYCSRGVVTYQAHQAGGGLDTVSIINNTFWNTYNTTISFNYDTAPSKTRNTIIANNIVYQPNGKMAWADYTTGLTFVNNNWSTTPPSFARSSGDYIGNPLFAQSPANNPAVFKLSANSPVINKGSLQSQIVIDYEGKLRKSSNSPGYDIGAYEYQGDVVAGNPVPTQTPVPTATPRPTSTPAPTQTPAPTAAIGPTATPRPTSTPVPTAVPTIAGAQDTTPPSVQITAPTDGSSIRNNNITVRAAASDNVKIARVRFYVDNVLKSTDSSGPDYSFTWKTNREKTGSHIVTAEAVDTAGNTARTSIVMYK